jgi:outer membrane protein insertion porin family
LAQRLQTRVGDPYDVLTLSEDLDTLAALMRQVNYSRQPMDDNRVRILFRVREFPRLRKLQVIGAQSLRRARAQGTEEPRLIVAPEALGPPLPGEGPEAIGGADLTLARSRIDLLADLKPGDLIDDNKIARLRRALLAEYRSMGLTRAKVEIHETPVLPSEIDPAAPAGFAQADLQIVIDEGERILVDDVVIEGNEAFSTTRLKFMMETKGSWWFVKNYYDDATFESDLALLRAFYAGQRGYFDVRVERGEFLERREGDRIIITPVVKIEEGEKYRLGSVTVRGARRIAPGELLAPFSRLRGRDFSGRAFAAALEEARKLYYDHGMLTTEIQPSYEYNAERRTVEVTLQVSERDRIYVRDVVLVRPRLDVEGDLSWFQRLYERVAPPISQEAIEREILLEPGEVYSKQTERDSIVRLSRLGIFSEVKIEDAATLNPRLRDAVVTLREGASGDFVAGVGFDSIGGGFAYAALNERNLFGDARDLRISFQLGSRASSASISYLDRFFQGTEDSLAASLYYLRFRRVGYYESKTGLTVERSRPLYGGWTGALRGRLEFVDLDSRGGFTPDEDLDKSYPVLSLRAGLTHDTSFPPVWPTEGRALAGGVEVGWADGPLVKLTAEGEFHYELAPKLIYRMKPSIGLIPYDSDEVGITERFFLGGTEDLRGFEHRGAGRRDSGDDEIAVGGAVKLLVRNELGFPIVGPLYGVLFVDAGTLGESPVDLETPRLSTGVGARIHMGRTTIVIDFAIPILKEGSDQTEFVHFTFRGIL